MQSVNAMNYPLGNTTYDTNHAMAKRRVSFNARDFKRWRKKHQFTQVEVARRIGVAMGTVSMWELGKRKPYQPL